MHLWGILTSLVSENSFLIQSFFSFQQLLRKKVKASFKGNRLVFDTSHPPSFFSSERMILPLSFNYLLIQLIHPIRDLLDRLGKCFMHLWGDFDFLVSLLFVDWHLYVFESLM